MVHLLTKLGKITDYITQNKAKVEMKYQELDIGSSLGDDNKFSDKWFPAIN